MPSKNVFPNKQVDFSLGRPGSLGKGKNTRESIATFARRFQAPLVTGEKFHEFQSASDKEQARLKGLNGWFIRCPIERGKRTRNTLLKSCIVTLDFDYADGAFLDDLRDGKLIPGTTMIAHSSRRHTPEKPRLRLIVFTGKPVEPEEYAKVSRILAQKIDPEMKFVDKVSFRPAQLMYMPTISRDMERYYVYHEQHGELLDWPLMVRKWERLNGSADNIGELPRAQGEGELREVAEEAEDPLTKTGPVGDFCRAYSITELVEGKDGEDPILGDVYTATEWNDGVISRMTYLGGTTSNGAVVYDDKFVYSHHGSDPTADQLVNAFDLVRLHKFADEDAKVEDDEVPMSKLPSVKAMKEFLRGDPYYREQQAESRYDLDAKFDDDDVDAEEEEDEAEDEGETNGSSEPSVDDLLGFEYEPKKSARLKSIRAEKPPKRWIAKELELSDDGIIKTTMPNITTIVTNDPRFWRKIGFNEFSRTINLLDDIKSKSRVIPPIYCGDKTFGKRWQDEWDITIRAVIECPTDKAGYGIKVGKEMVADAIRLSSMNNRFHPVRDYLYECADKHEDSRRLRRNMETLFIRYLGLDDTPYARQVASNIIIASVARIMEPGCKFDYAPIIEGRQNLGKSLFIKTLYGKQWFGELHTDLKDDKKSAEAMLGNWVMELPELSAMHKSDHNDAKAFITRTHDDVRLSYDRHVSELPRQTVLWGTTNDAEYLRDPTGNRRYWPIPATVDRIDILGLREERDAIWAAGVHAYLEMREGTTGDLRLELTGAALREAENLQGSRRKKDLWETWRDALDEWLEEPVLLRQLLMEVGHDEFETTYKGYSTDNTWVRRVAFTQQIAMKNALEQHSAIPSNNVASLAWQQVVASYQKEGWEKKKRRLLGTSMHWIVAPGALTADIARGFILDESPHGFDESDTQVAEKPDDEAAALL